MKLISAFILAVKIANQSDIPAPTTDFEPFKSNGFAVESVEIKDMATNKSIDYSSSNDAWARNCLRRAYLRTKRILDQDLPELEALKASEGPNKLKIVISDWTSKNIPDNKVRSAEILYKGANDVPDKDGVILIQAHAKKAADGSTICNAPEENDLVAFAGSTKRSMDYAIAQNELRNPKIVNSVANRKPAFVPEMSASHVGKLYSDTAN